jgi:hypothetical protein
MKQAAMSACLFFSLENGVDMFLKNFSLFAMDYIPEGRTVL